MKILLTSVPQPAYSIMPNKLKPLHKMLNVLGGGKPILGIQPPYGLMYLSAYLKAAGHEVLVFDGLLTTAETIMAELKDGNIGLVGISCVSCNWDAAMSFAGAVKGIGPHIKIAVGGAHVNAVKEQVLKECGYVDFAFYGDSEETFTEVVSCLASGKTLPADLDGFAFRCGGGVRAAASPAVIKDLDGMMFPDRAALGLDNYRPSPLYYKKLPYTALFGSRGCPHKCNFCHTESNSRMRSPGSLIAEIEQLQHDFGIREIMFYDDTFTLDRNRAIEFCELLTARNIKLSWSASTRADSVDPEILRLMKKAGCWKLAVGVESGSQRVLDRIRKGETLEMIEQALAQISAAGMQTTGFFMFGQPTETYEEGLETIAYMKRVKLDFAHVNSLAPFPGTEVYKEVVKTPGFRGLKAMNAFNIAYVPETMTEAQLEYLLKASYRQFYFRPAYVLRQIRHIRSVMDLSRYLRGLVVAVLSAFMGDK